MEAAVNAGKFIEFEAELLSYPGRSKDVFTTSALIGMGLGEEVEMKFSHLIM